MKLGTHEAGAHCGRPLARESGAASASGRARPPQKTVEPAGQVGESALLAALLPSPSRSRGRGSALNPEPQGWEASAAGVAEAEAQAQAGSLRLGGGRLSFLDRGLSFPFGARSLAPSGAALRSRHGCSGGLVVWLAGWRLGHSGLRPSGCAGVGAFLGSLVCWPFSPLVL